MTLMKHWDCRSWRLKVGSCLCACAVQVRVLKMQRAQNLIELHDSAHALSNRLKHPQQRTAKARTPQPYSLAAAMSTKALPPFCLCLVSSSPLFRPNVETSGKASNVSVVPSRAV